MSGWFHAFGGGVGLVCWSIARLASAAVAWDVEEGMADGSDFGAGIEASSCFCVSAPEEAL